MESELKKILREREKKVASCCVALTRDIDTFHAYTYIFVYFSIYNKWAWHLVVLDPYRNTLKEKEEGKKK